MYNYGGLWIYPSAALVGAAGLTGYAPLKSDQAYYLDHPDQFARFYLLLRGYSAASGLVGVVIAFALARSVGAGRLTAAACGLTFALLPAVVAFSHEAKPHLPGAVLVMLAALLAHTYATRSHRRAGAIATGAAAGSAVGMVMSVWPAAAAIIAAVGLIRPSLTPKQRWIDTALAAGAAAGVYCLSNPFAVLRALTGHPIWREHVANFSSFYAPSFSTASLTNALLILAEAAGPLTLIALAAAGLVLAARFVAGSTSANRHTAPIDTPAPTPLAAPAACVLAAAGAAVAIQFVVLAGGKSADYARFGIVTAIAVSMLAVLALRCLLPRWAAYPAMATLLATLAIHSGGYLLAFRADAGASTSRSVAAQTLARVAAGSAEKTLAVPADPAPYIVPPMDLIVETSPPRRTSLDQSTSQGGSPGASTPTDIDARVVVPPVRKMQGMTWANRLMLIEVPPVGDAPPTDDSTR